MFSILAIPQKDHLHRGFFFELEAYVTFLRLLRENLTRKKMLTVKKPDRNSEHSNQNIVDDRPLFRLKVIYNISELFTVLS